MLLLVYDNRRKKFFGEYNKHNSTNEWLIDLFNTNVFLIYTFKKTIKQEIFGYFQGVHWNRLKQAVETIEKKLLIFHANGNKMMSIRPLLVESSVIFIFYVIFFDALCNHY